MNAVALSNMSIEEKLAIMEQIWDDLCQHQNVQSPDWHQDVLQIREKTAWTGKNSRWTGRKLKRKSITEPNEFKNSAVGQ